MCESVLPVQQEGTPTSVKYLPLFSGDMSLQLDDTLLLYKINHRYFSLIASELVWMIVCLQNGQVSNTQYLRHFTAIHVAVS